MRKLLLIMLCILTPCMLAQQPATQSSPIFQVNSQYTNGVAPGYWPTAGAGLTLKLSSGTNVCGGVVTQYTAGTLSMIANTTNYIYIGGSCVPASKTGGFSVFDIPLAVVITGASSITSITDVRNSFNSASIPPANAGVLGTDANQNFINATSVLSNYLPFLGGTMTGPIALPGNATTPLQAVPLQQLQSSIPAGIAGQHLAASGVAGVSQATGVVEPTTGNVSVGTGVPDSAGIPDTSGTVATAVQQNNPYVLRNVQNKAALMYLNSKAATYGNICGPNSNLPCAPQQLIWMLTGDSTVSYIDGSLICTAAADMGGFVGYLGSGFQGLHYYPSNLCGAYVGNIALQGSTTATTTDYTHFPAGTGYNVPAGSCVVGEPSNTSSNTTRIITMYDVEPGAGTLTLSWATTLAGSYTTYATINASNATLAGGISDYILTSPITAYSINSNVITITGTNATVPTAGQQIMLQGFPTSTFLNGIVLTVTSATSTTVVAPFTHTNTGATESGTYQNPAQNYFIKACASGAGAVNVAAFGQIDTMHNGVVAGGVGNRPGLGIPDLASTSSAITSVWWNDVKPDVLGFHMADNASGGTQAGTCYQSTTAAPSVYQPYGYWFNLWASPFLAANPTMDLALPGSYTLYSSVSSPTFDPCVTPHNNALRSYAQANKGVYLDVEYMANMAQSLALNCNATPHESEACNIWMSQYAIGLTGLDRMSLSSYSSQNTANTVSASGEFDVFATGTGFTGFSPTFNTQSRLKITGAGSYDASMIMNRSLYINTLGGTSTAIFAPPGNSNVQFPQGIQVDTTGSYLIGNGSQNGVREVEPGSYYGRFQSGMFNFATLYTPATSTTTTAYWSGGPTPWSGDLRRDSYNMYLYDTSLYTAWRTIPIFPFQPTGYMYANGAGAGTASTTIPQTAVVAGTLYSAAGTPLPTCASGIKGQTLVVSDATAPLYMTAYTSGGGITADVICSYNGTTYAWLTH